MLNIKVKLSETVTVNVDIPEEDTMVKLLKSLGPRAFLEMVVNTFEAEADPNAQPGTYGMECYEYASAISCAVDDVR